MSKTTDPDHERTLRVKLVHPEAGDIGDGDLTFGYSHLGHFALDQFVPEVTLTEAQWAQGLVARAEDGRTYTLFNCELKGHSVYPEFVVEGTFGEDAFVTFEVRFAEVSEWFFQDMRIDGEAGEKLEWTSVPAPLVAEVAMAGLNFKSESRYFGKLQSHGEDRTLHQHFEFRFTATHDRFTLPTIRQLAHRFSALLSLLLAYPCPVVSIDVWSDDQHGGRLYYGLFKTPSKADPKKDLDRTSWRLFLTMKRDIESVWDDLVNKFFRSTYLDVIWIRLAGMQNYDGFWDFRVLGYVTLLDGYVDRQFKKGPPAPHTKKLVKLAGALGKLKSRLSAQQTAEVMDAATKIFSSTDTFESKLDALIASLDPQVVKVINLSKADFDLIKSVRDQIAHALEPVITGRDVTPAVVITNRIILLLTFVFFGEVGLKGDVFLRGLDRPHLKLRQDSMIDEVELDRALRPGNFMTVTQAGMTGIKGRPRPLHNCVITRDRDGLISYSEKLSSDFQNKPRTHRTIKPHELLELPEAAVSYLGDAYFECGSEKTSTYNTFMVDLALVLA